MLPVSGHEDIFLLCNKEGTACAVKGEIYLTIISSVVDTIEIKEKWLFCKICKIVMISFTLWCLNPGSRLEPQTPQESPLTPPPPPPPPSVRKRVSSLTAQPDQVEAGVGWGAYGICSIRRHFHLSVWRHNSSTPQLIIQFCKQIPRSKFEHQELDIWQLLSGHHPNIVELYGAVQTKEHVIIFMEFMEGTVTLVTNITSRMFIMYFVNKNHKWIRRTTVV